MARNSSGTYSLAEPPFTPNTTISSTAVNSDFNDIADALTDSLSRTGLGGMLAALPLATAGFAYSADPDTGMSRTAANTQVITVGGDNWTFTETDVTSPDGISLLPLIGEVRMWALPTAPTGWIFMRGQACTVTYPIWRAALIAATNPYGTSGADPLFPNMQCVIPAGLDASARGLLTGSTVLGALLGTQTKTIAIANMPAHDHGGATLTENTGTTHLADRATAAGTQQFVTGVGADAVTGIANTPTATGNPTPAHFHGISAQGSGTPLSVVQPTIVLNFIGRAA